MKFAERYQDILKRNKAFLDVHLTNRCNLNCCCCQRLSPLCDSETDYTFNEFKNDFDKILKFPDFNELEIISFSGGEPLVNPDFFKIIKYVRKFYKGKIDVLSNGIKVLQFSDDEINFIKNNVDSFRITRYYNSNINYKKIIQRLPFVTFFNSGDSEGEKRITVIKQFFNTREIPKIFQKTRCNCSTVILYKGRFFNCPQVLVAPFANKFFNLSYEEEFLNLSEINSFNSLFNTLQEKTIKLCKFCSIDYYKNSMKWKISSRQRNEFVNDKLFNVFQDRVNFKKI